MTSRHWCFTIHENHTGDPQALVDWDKSRYVVYQEEICPDTKRLHHQGYVELVSPQRLSALNKVCPAHWERRRGTAAEARDYCMKEESRAPDTQPVESGEFGGSQGRRKDLRHIKDILDDGGSLLECYDADFATTCRYERSFMKYRMLITPPRTWKPVVELYWGKTGTGKSRKAFGDNPGAYVSPKTKWWDGYDGQECIIVDDYVGQWPLDTMLNLIDRYECPIENKGGSYTMLARKIVITSNLTIEQWYPNVYPEQIAALRRRFDKIIFYGI